MISGEWRQMVIVASLMLLVASVANAQVRIGLSAPADSTRSGGYVWSKALADRLHEAGMVTRIFPNSSIGSEVVRTEQVLLGLLEINITGSQEVAVWAELIEGLQLPFLLKGADQLEALVAHTDFLDRINARTVPRGMRAVALVYSGGMSGLFTVNTPVRHPTDLRSLRLRAMTSQQLAYFEAWGTAGTQVAWEEVPQALGTGIADGYLNPPIVAVMFGHGTQLDYFIDLAMSPSMRVAVVSEHWYQSLDDRSKRLLEAAIAHASEVNRRWNAVTRKNEFEMLRGHGIEVIELNDAEREPFRSALEPLYDQIVSPAVQREMRGLLREAESAMEG